MANVTRHVDQPTTIGVLGATSPVGQQVLEILKARADVQVVAFSREPKHESDSGVQWVTFSAEDAQDLKSQRGSIQLWIAASPIWIVHEHFDLFQQLNAERVVCLSSTSQFTKVASSSPYEEQVVQRLIDGERALMEWAGNCHVGWTVLRPTLIYGRGNDRNLSEIVKIIKRLKVFPLFGKALGLRQPVYVDDVAMACVQAVFSGDAANKAYNISGQEKLTYKEMVSRVFAAMGLKPRLISINLSLFNAALFFLKMMPRYRNWNADMVMRMNRDMVFDHDDASKDFGFKPQAFILAPRDIDV